MKILLVEDEPAIREPLARLLASEGWQVLCAGTQAQAMELLETNTLDAALIDLGLPDGDGFAVSRAVRAAGDAAILILTARTDEWSAVQSLEGGADDYIEKPLRARELIARLRAVQRRRAHTERCTCRGLVVDTRTMQASLNGALKKISGRIARAGYFLLRLRRPARRPCAEWAQALRTEWGRIIQSPSSPQPSGPASYRKRYAQSPDQNGNCEQQTGRPHIFPKDMKRIGSENICCASCQRQ